MFKGGSMGYREYFMRDRILGKDTVCKKNNTEPMTINCRLFITVKRGSGILYVIGICKVIGERQGNVTMKHITDGNYC